MQQSQAQNWGQPAQAPGMDMEMGAPAQQNPGMAGIGAALGGIVGSLTGNNPTQQQGQGWGQSQQPVQQPMQQGWGQDQNGRTWGNAPQAPAQQPVQQGQGWGQLVQPQAAPVIGNISNTEFSNKSRSFGNGVILKKGQKINLSTDNSIHEVDVCLGWDAIPGYDLDASAFLLGANGKVLGDEWFVFYGQQDSPDRAIHHSGNSTGENTGDDEIINIKLD